MTVIVSAADLPDEQSTLRTKDQTSQKVRQYFQAISEGDMDYVNDFFADDLQVAVNSKVIQGKKNYIDRLKRIREVLFEQIEFGPNHVHTNYFGLDAIGMSGKTFAEEGLTKPPVWSNAWTTFRAEGRNTKKPIRVPIHIDFRWEDDKVVNVLIFCDPAFLTAEEAAAVKN